MLTRETSTSVGCYHYQTYVHLKLGQMGSYSVIINHNSLLTNLTVHTHYSGASEGYLDNLWQTLFSTSLIIYFVRLPPVVQYTYNEVNLAHTMVPVTSQTANTLISKRSASKEAPTDKQFYKCFQLMPHTGEEGDSNVPQLFLLREQQSCLMVMRLQNRDNR